MLTGQIKQRFFAIEGELRNEPITHNTVSVCLNTGSVGFQEVILPAILRAVGQRGNELLHLFIGQVLVGIAGGYIALLAGVAGWGAVCAPDNPHIREIRAQLLDCLICAAVGVAHSLFKLCGQGDGLGSKIYYIRLTHCFALPPSKICGVRKRYHTCFFFWKKCVKLLLGDCLFFVVGIGL